MLTSILLYSNIIVFSIDILYLAKLRIKSKNEVIKILRDNDYYIPTDKEEKIFYDLDCYLSRKYRDYQGLNSLRSATLLPISNVIVLIHILNKELKNQYEEIPSYALDKEFIKESYLIKNTPLEKECSKVIPMSPVITPENNKVKIRVLKK